MGGCASCCVGGKHNSPGGVQVAAASSKRYISVLEQLKGPTTVTPKASIGTDAATVSELDGLLEPIFTAVRSAYYAQPLCEAVYAQYAALGGAIVDSPVAKERLQTLQDLSWNVHEFVCNFSNRGWLQRAQHGDKVEALFTNLMSDLAAVARQWAAAVVELDQKQVAVSIRTVRKLAELLHAQLTSIQAPHAKAADADAFDALMRRIASLLHGVHDGALQLLIHCELQTFAVQTSMGPHTALRHPDLQLFWWMHMGGQEESPWTSLWPHLHEFLACAPKVLLSEDGVGDQTELIRILAQPENLKQLQAAMHRMGFANYINAAELDMAFPLGSTLQEQIEALLQQRPMLLARTSKGAMVLPRTPLQQQLEDVVQAGLAGLLAGPTGGSIMDDDDYKSGLSEASRASSSTFYTSQTQASMTSSLQVRLEPAAAGTGTGGRRSSFGQCAVSPMHASSSHAGGRPASAQGYIDRPASPGAMPTIHSGKASASAGGIAAQALASMLGDDDTPALGTYHSHFDAEPTKSTSRTSAEVDTPRPVELSLTTIIGRHADISHLAGVLCGSGAAARGRVRLLVLAGSPGSGKSAVATAVSNRLAREGVWHTHAYCDVRQAQDMDAVALALCIGLNVPFYAADRPAAPRLLAWLRRHGASLGPVGLLLDNIGSLLLHGNATSTATKNNSAGGGDSACEAGTSLSAEGAAQLAGPAAANSAAAGPTTGPADLCRRLLRFLSEVLALAPGLQVIATASYASLQQHMLPPPGRLSHELSTLCTLGVEERLAMGVYELPPLSLASALQMLGAAAGRDGLQAEEFAPLAQACGCLPGLLRLAAASIRSGSTDARMIVGSASTALQRAADAGHETLAVDAFMQHMVAHCVLVLPPTVRNTLSILSHLGAALTDNEILAACAAVGHPVLVRSALCSLYDRGLVSFQDLGQRHEVDSNVRTLFVSTLSSLSTGSSFVSRLPPDKDIAQKLRGFLDQLESALNNTTELYNAGWRLTAVRHYNHSRALVDGGLATLSQALQSKRLPGATAARFVGVLARHLNAICRHVLTPCQQERLALALAAIAQALPSAQERLTGHAAAARALVHLKNLHAAALQMDAAAQSAVAVYPSLLSLEIMRPEGSPLLSLLADRSSAGRSSRVMAALSFNDQRSTRPSTSASLVAQVKSNAADPRESSSAGSLTGSVDGVRGLQSLPSAAGLTEGGMAAQAGSVLNAEAKQRASQGSSTLMSAINRGSTAPRTPQGKQSVLAAQGQRPSPMPWSVASLHGAAGGGITPAASSACQSFSEMSRDSCSQTMSMSSALADPQVGELLLARAELAAVCGKAAAAELYLATYTACLDSAGRRNSPEYAQARMRQGDLVLAMGKPPSEAARHYSDAQAVLQALHGQLHFLVARAMLAVVKCRVPVLAAGVSVLHDAVKTLDLEFGHLLLIQHVAQGKFNLDVAYVLLAQAHLQATSHRAEAALTSAVKALEIVIEILGDGSPQVSECLSVMVKALQALEEGEAAEKLSSHASALREPSQQSRQHAMLPARAAVGQLSATEVLVVEVLGPRHPHAVAMLPPLSDLPPELPTQNPSLLTASSAFAKAPAAGTSFGGASTRATAEAASSVVDDEVVTPAGVAPVMVSAAAGPSAALLHGYRPISFNHAYMNPLAVLEDAADGLKPAAEGDLWQPDSAMNAGAASASAAVTATLHGAGSVPQADALASGTRPGPAPSFSFLQASAQQDEVVAGAAGAAVANGSTLSQQPHAAAVPGAEAVCLDALAYQLLQDGKQVDLPSNVRSFYALKQSSLSPDKRSQASRVTPATPSSRPPPLDLNEFVHDPSSSATAHQQQEKQQQKGTVPHTLGLWPPRAAELAADDADGAAAGSPVLSQPPNVIPGMLPMRPSTASDILNEFLMDPNSHRLVEAGSPSRHYSSRLSHAIAGGAAGSGGGGNGTGMVVGSMGRGSGVSLAPIRTSSAAAAVVAALHNPQAMQQQLPPQQQPEVLAAGGSHRGLKPAQAAELAASSQSLVHAVQQALAASGSQPGSPSHLQLAGNSAAGTKTGSKLPHAPGHALLLGADGEAPDSHLPHVSRRGMNAHSRIPSGHMDSVTPKGPLAASTAQDASSFFSPPKLVGAPESGEEVALVLDMRGLGSSLVSNPLFGAPSRGAEGQAGGTGPSSLSSTPLYAPRSNED